MSSNITVQINLEYKKNISQKLIIDVANIARKIGSKGLCSSSIGIVITNNVDMYDSKMIVPAEGKANKCLYLLWRLSVAFKKNYNI